MLSSKDYNWLEDLKKDLQYTGPILTEVHKTYQKTIYKLRITSKDLYDALEKHGCIERKSLVLEFPMLPIELEPHFIRGYFDGDGTVSRNKYLRGKDTLRLTSGICSGSIKFVQAVLDRLPVKHKKIYTKRTQALSHFSLSPNDSMLFYHYMYDTATIYLQRKYQIFQDELQRRSETIIAHLQNTSKEHIRELQKKSLERRKQTNDAAYQKSHQHKLEYMREYNRKKAQKMKE